MKAAYRVIHRLPDGTEQEICTVDSLSDVDFYVETAQYAGTWLDKRRKLLRYGLGLIEIREMVKPMKIVSEKVIQGGPRLECKLGVENCGKVEWLILSSHRISAYDKGMKARLWEVDNFAMLADKLNKPIAYDCMKIYESLNGLDDFKGSM